MNYLVTGGAGFIGSSIVEHLVAQGEGVRVIDNYSTGRRENIGPFLKRIEFIEDDLRDPKVCGRAVQGMDYVLHQAAIPSVPRSVADPLTTHEANATATLNLLAAARDAKVKRFVLASSSSVYGDHEADSKSESLEPRPLSPYAASKAACEHYLKAFHRCYGLETVGLRYFNVFGPRQDPKSPYSAVIPKFITAALHAKRPMVHGDGLQARDFTYVENNVRANIQAATGRFQAEGQAYNIACGASHTLLELLGAVNELLGTHIVPEHDAARVGDVRLSKADIRRAQSDLGYAVSVPFMEGLRRTIAWYRQGEHA